MIIIVFIFTVGNEFDAVGVMDGNLWIAETTADLRQIFFGCGHHFGLFPPNELLRSDALPSHAPYPVTAPIINFFGCG